jgi:hypothetical protein
MTTTAKPTVTLAADDETLVRDCYACLTAIGNRNSHPLLPPFTLGCNTPTPLEGVLVVELAHARLARHINYQEEHIEVDAGAKLLFHGAETLNHVSPEDWAEFTRRMQALRLVCAPRV